MTLSPKHWQNEGGNMEIVGGRDAAPCFVRGLELGLRHLQQPPCAWILEL